MGVVRHADAGYALAKETARVRGLDSAECAMRVDLLITGISQLATAEGAGGEAWAGDA